MSFVYTTLTTPLHLTTQYVPQPAAVCGSRQGPTVWFRKNGTGRVITVIHLRYRFAEGVSCRRALEQRISSEAGSRSAFPQL